MDIWNFLKYSITFAEGESAPLISCEPPPEGRVKSNMLPLSIKDEQLQNILSNKYLNSSARAKKRKKEEEEA